MTIIFSCIPADDSPPYLGTDMLVSSTVPDSVFDTISKRNQEASKYASLNELRQKLYILHPYIAIAVAGDVEIADKFIEKIIQTISENTVDPTAFISEANYAYGVTSNTKRPFGFTAIIYDANKNQFFHHQQQCIQHNSTQFGELYYQGSGSALFKAQIIENEFLEKLNPNHDPLELRSIHRAMNLCYRLYALECIGAADETPRKDGIGSFYEFCFFCVKDKTFKYIDLIKILYWRVFITRPPHFSVQFGYSPREGENETDTDFRITENKYDENGLTIFAYDNISATSSGHIMALKTYSVKRFTKSLYPFSNEYSGKFTFNCYYLPDTPSEQLDKLYTKIENANQPWLSIEPHDKNYLVKINKTARIGSIHRAKDFFDSRWINHDQRRTLVFDNSQILKYQELERVREQAKLLRRVGDKESLIKSRDLYRIGQNLARQLNLRFLTTDCIFSEATCEEYLKDRRKAEPLLLKARQEFSIMMHTPLWTACLNSLGILYKNDFIEQSKEGLQAEARKSCANARDVFLECLNIQEEMDMHNSLAVTRVGYASLLSADGLQDEALEIINKAIDYRRLNDTNDSQLNLSRLAKALNVRALIYSKKANDNPHSDFGALAETDKLEAVGIFTRLGYDHLATESQQC